MRELMQTVQRYTILILRPGPNRQMDGVESIIWEHGRRNMRLRAEGVLAIVMPVGDPEISGIGIFRASVDEATEIMADDPGVRAGVFVTEFYSGRSFPGDSL
jgi:hypothetical protein